MLRQPLAVLLVVTFVFLTDARQAEAKITAEEVNAAIDQGISYLRKKQNPDKGNWPEYTNQPGALTSLCTLALINAGVSPQDPAIQKALTYLRTMRPERTYATSLQTMVFCIAEPKKDMILIRRNARWLESAQLTAGPRRGAWDYSSRKTVGDNSNSQFALLALHEAERVGVKVRADTWELARRYWLDCQRPEGSWGYYKNEPGSGSMTCAGICSLIIASGKVGQDAKVEGDRILCCNASDVDENQVALENGLAWLGRNFAVSHNPSINKSRTWHYYYLYGMERAGRMTGRRFLGRHDWYRRGSQFLVQEAMDRLTGSWRGETRTPEGERLIATSLALLFLGKGRRPVVMAKLKFGGSDDWNRHRHDAANLTRYVEKKWKRDLTWQVIDIAAASPADLLQSPVLLISGREALDFDKAQKASLKAYVDGGGFLFFVGCCEGKNEQFDKSFKALMKEIFPDSRLRELLPDHPVWFAEEKVDPNFVRPGTLYGD